MAMERGNGRRIWGVVPRKAEEYYERVSDSDRLRKFSQTLACEQAFSPNREPVRKRGEN